MPNVLIGREASKTMGLGAEIGMKIHTGQAIGGMEITITGMGAIMQAARTQGEVIALTRVIGAKSLPQTIKMRERCRIVSTLPKQLQMP